MASMKSFRPHEIRRAAEVWRDVDHKQWLLVADFAEIAGRIECVGMELRSYVRLKETLSLEQDDWPTSEEFTYESYWRGGPVSEAPAGGHVDEGARLARLDPSLHELASHDLLAVEAGASEVGGLKQPHRLRTETLRDLPLGAELKRLRAELAERTGSLGEALVDLHLAVEREAANESAVSELEGWKESLSQARSAMSSLPKRPGRPAKYDRALLERVAAIYTEAYRTGSYSPTQDVCDVLGLGSRDVAGKLVMKCRRAGLLAATAPRTAGGVLPDAQPGEERSMGEGPDGPSEGVQ